MSYIKREDWVDKKFCFVRQNPEGEYDVVGARTGTVVFTSPFEDARRTKGTCGTATPTTSFG